jgi:hypothetical protein
MGTYKAVFILFFLLASAAAQQTSPTLFTVEGTVINSASGRPVPRALVHLSGRAMLSGGEGEFSFDAVSPGKAQIWAYKPGYFAPGSNAGQSSIIIDVGPDAGKVMLKLAPEAVIFGHVTGNDEEPLEGASVDVLKLAVMNGRMRLQLAGPPVRTDEDGNYRMAGLAPGRYYVSVKSGNLTRRILGVQTLKRSQDYPLVVYQPGSEDLASATMMDLAPGQRAEAAFSLALRPSFKVAGVVATLGEWKQINPPMFVDALDMPLRQPEQFDPQSGTFEFRSVPAGTYRLRCGGTDADSNHYEFSDRTVTVSQPVTNLKLLLKRGARIPVEFHTQFNQRNGGVCTYNVGGETRHSDCSDLPAASVELISASGAYYQFALDWRPADSAGFAISGVPAGKYIVHTHSQSLGYVQSLRSGGRDLLREELVVPEEGSVAPIEVVMRDDAATLEVLVHGAAIARQAMVVLIPEARFSDLQFQVIGGKIAKTSLQPLSPGAYSVLAFDSTDGLDYQNPDALAPYLGKAASVRVSPHQNASVTVELIHIGE